MAAKECLLEIANEEIVRQVSNVAALREKLTGYQAVIEEAHEMVSACLESLKLEETSGLQRAAASQSIPSDKESSLAEVHVRTSSELTMDRRNAIKGPRQLDAVSSGTQPPAFQFNFGTQQPTETMSSLSMFQNEFENFST